MGGSTSKEQIISLDNPQGLQKPKISYLWAFSAGNSKIKGMYRFVMLIVCSYNTRTDWRRHIVLCSCSVCNLPFRSDIQNLAIRIWFVQIKNWNKKIDVWGINSHKNNRLSKTESHFLLQCRDWPFSSLLPPLKETWCTDLFFSTRLIGWFPFAAFWKGVTGMEKLVCLCAVQSLLSVEVLQFPSIKLC